MNEHRDEALEDSMETKERLWKDGGFYIDLTWVFKWIWEKLRRLYVCKH